MDTLKVEMDSSTLFLICASVLLTVLVVVGVPACVENSASYRATELAYEQAKMGVCTTP